MADIVILPRDYQFDWSFSGQQIHKPNSIFLDCSANPDLTRSLYWRAYDPDGWVTWQPNVTTAGEYDVYVYIPKYNYSSSALVTTQAKYYLDGNFIAQVDQNNNKCEWLWLGRRNLTSGVHEIHMPSYTGETSTDPYRLIAADGLKLVYVPPPTYSISGRAVTAGGAAVSGVTIQLSNGASTTTDGNGDYWLGGILAGNYTLTPSRPGDTFAPTSRSFYLSGNLTGQNFTLDTRYSISGRVTEPEGAPISGVTVQLSTGASTTTNGSGEYTFGGLLAGNYTVTPSRPGDIFSPGNRSFYLSANLTSQDFSLATRYDISGRVTDPAGNPISGVTITLNTGASTTSNSSGQYAFVQQLVGNYTVTPSRAGDVFAPGNRSFYLSAPAVEQDFTVTSRYFISGRLKDTNDNPIPDADVICEGVTTSITRTSDGNGNYVCADLAAGVYLVKTNSDAYTFSPKVHGWFFVPNNQINQDFTTEPVYGSASGQVVVEGTTQPVGNARISIGGKATLTDSNGNYTLSGLLPNNHQVYVSASRYQKYQRATVIQPNTTTALNFALQPVPVDGYRLPFPGGAIWTLNNTYHTSGYAQDWGMPVGTDVAAARDGKVLYVKEDSDTGGCSAAYSQDANYVALQHEDGSTTWYVHLSFEGANVNVGDTVKSGQVIGKSGRTGFTCEANLHFAWQNSSGKRMVPTFIDVTTNGGVPQVGRSYTSGNYMAGGLRSGQVMAADVTPPVGQVRFYLGSLAPYDVKLLAFDFGSSALQMRVAANETELAEAAWQAFAPTIQWNQPAITAQFKDEEGNLSPVYRDIIEPSAYEPLQAEFFVKSNVCSGEALPIENRSFPLCEQCQWSWNLSDQKVIQGMEPQQTDPFDGFSFVDPGSYTITLTGTNLHNTSTAAHDVQVLPSPSLAYTFAQFGNTVWVQALDDEAEGWFWDFGDGTLTNGRVAMHTYADYETLLDSAIRLTVTNSNSCTLTTVQYDLTSIHTYFPIVVR